VLRPPVGRHEPYESRGSRADLWGPAGEIPAGYPADLMAAAGEKQMAIDTPGRTLLVEACRLALARGGAALSALSAGLAWRVRVWESHISGALWDQQPITTSASLRRRSSRSCLEVASRL
jgi:hypothetical protein